MDPTFVLSALAAAAIASLAAVARYAPVMRRRATASGVPELVLDPVPAAVPASSSTAPSRILSKLDVPADPAAAASGPRVPNPSPAPMAEPADALVGSHEGPAAHDHAAEESLVDRATGLANRRGWDQVFRYEEHRFARYGNKVTVLLAELEGLDSLASILGQDAADRLIVPIAAAMRRSARQADFLARTGHARFAALLPETDEVAAVNYAERVCAACDLWLEAGGVGVRLVIGWAQAIAGGSLSDAMCVAYDRMNADRRRRRPSPAPFAAMHPPRDRYAPAGAGNQGHRDGRSASGLSLLNRDRGGRTGDAA